MESSDISKKQKTLCKDCLNGNKQPEVEWDKIEQGDSEKKRCSSCKGVLDKTCCRDCGYFQSDPSKRCSHCRYLDKWGPNGYDYHTEIIGE